MTLVTVVSLKAVSIMSMVHELSSRSVIPILSKVTEQVDRHLARLVEKALQLALPVCRVFPLSRVSRTRIGLQRVSFPLPRNKDDYSYFLDK